MKSLKFDDIKIFIQKQGNGFVHWSGKRKEKDVIFSIDFKTLMTYFEDDFTEQEVRNAIN